MSDETELLVCVNRRLGKKSCGGSGSRKLMEKLELALQQRALSFRLVEQYCLGRCEQGICMRIAPGGDFFTEVTEQDLDTILNALEQHCT